MLINLTELFSIDGKEKDYTCDIEIHQLCTSKTAYDIVKRSRFSCISRILETRSFFLQAAQR